MDNRGSLRIPNDVYDEFNGFYEEHKSEYHTKANLIRSLVKNAEWLLKETPAELENSNRTLRQENAYLKKELNNVNDLREKLMQINTKLDWINGHKDDENLNAPPPIY